MIIEVQNFKSIGEKISLELKPLTILVGANGAGKSSILEALAIMGQSPGADIFNYSGNLVKFDSLREIFHKSLTSQPLIFSLEVFLKDYEKKLLESTSSFFGIPSAKLNNIRYEYSIYFRKYDQNPVVEQSLFINKSKVVQLSTDIAKQPEIRILNVGINEPKKYTSLDNGKGFSFLNAEAFRIPQYAELNPVYEATKMLVDTFYNNLQVSVLLSTRGRVAHFGSTDVEPLNVGPEGEYTIQILSKIFGSSEYDDIREKIANWASKFGLEELRAGWRQANNLSVDYFDSILKHNLNVSLAGFGSKQALTMLVELFWSKEGSVILIEEPEINLHPEARTLLPNLFAEVIKEGKKIIVSTHSEIIILALSKPIKEKIIDKSQINVYNVEKTNTGTEIRKFDISERGYIKEWIPSFTKVETDLLNDFLDSVPKE